jgi:hypothetical protein
VTKFNGLIQHSFALRMGEARRSFGGRSNRASVAERLEPGTGGGNDFRVKALYEELGDGSYSPPSPLSPLVECETTTLRPRPLRLLADDVDGGSSDQAEWPRALRWARGKTAAEDCGAAARPRMSFAEFDEDHGRTSENDFLVERSESSDCAEQGRRIARALLEALAFRRSQLFGLAVANRFINVMLPCAVLEYVGEDECGEIQGKAAGGDLILQPFLSLMRDSRSRRELRDMYSLTLFAIPIEGGEWCPRKMSKREIESIVVAGWGIADSPPRRAISRYAVSGPLSDYAIDLGGSEVNELFESAARDGTVSLRQAAEITAFSIALRMAGGAKGRALGPTRRRIGDDVVTSLGTARVSAAVLVDPDLTEGEIKTPIRERDPPGSLRVLMRTIACETRPPDPWTPHARRRYTLDRPFVDGHDYAVGVLPRNRCLLVANVPRKRRTDSEPLLSQVAAVTYMTIGAATAIGTMRAIDRDLERMEGEDPRKIAEIEGEIAADLHELYDLDITRETYRHLYRRLCKQLGIVRDYKTLQKKMEALYRATSTNETVKSQRLLMGLTVVLAVLTVLLIIKPGG